MTSTVSVPLIEWELRRLDASDEPKWVRLPHDAMLSAPRGPHAAGGADTGWFEGGDYEYRTAWTAPERPDEGGSAVLLFEGVQGDAAVSVNGRSLGVVRSGYTEVELPIDDLCWSARNEIAVRVAHRAQPSERWYPGSGLYRPVKVIVRPHSHFARDAVRVRTRELTPRLALVEIDVAVANAPADARITAELSDTRGVVVRAGIERARGTLHLQVPAPRPWSAEDPHRYFLTVRAVSSDGVLDEYTEQVGLRTVAVDGRRGLRINGAEVLLRGACIHHDNGPLGAATHRAAEYRRIRLLKEAGFNAIRSAHNPLSRHLLDACDELGMYVLDEFADYWFVRKTAHDHSDRFRETWRDDAAAMIAKDRNRACVIMYAIGNEIPETALPEGVELTGEISDFFRTADPQRPVTVAINLFVNALVSLGVSPYDRKQPPSDTAEAGSVNSLAGSTEANAMVNHIGKMMHLVARLPRADKASRDAFAAVDVAGYNYGLARYRQDLRRYPDRVILGTETLPGDIAWAWRLVTENPAVIGDFVWAGWEYLGEAGVAVWVPGKRAGLSKPYPYVVAGPGMFDLTGRPDASLRLAQAAWGLLSSPVITVRPLDRSGRPYVRSAWRVTDAVESWSWSGSVGRRAEIEVYATEEEVELVLNGRSLGRRKAGARRGFRARFATPYEPGTLVAIGYRGGRAISRSELTSARGDIRVRLRPESPEILVGGDDLAFVHVELSDEAGSVEMLADERIELSVSGPAELVAFASADPAPEESFLTPGQRTYRGRALAILRSTTETGTVRITARAGRAGTAHVELRANERSAAEAVSDGGAPLSASVPSFGELHD